MVILYIFSGGRGRIPHMDNSCERMRDLMYGRESGKRIGAFDCGLSASDTGSVYSGIELILEEHIEIEKLQRYRNILYSDIFAVFSCHEKQF